MLLLRSGTDVSVFAIAALLVISDSRSAAPLDVDNHSPKNSTLSINHEDEMCGVVDCQALDMDNSLSSEKEEAFNLACRGSEVSAMDSACCCKKRSGDGLMLQQRKVDSVLNAFLIGLY